MLASSMICLSRIGSPVSPASVFERAEEIPRSRILLFRATASKLRPREELVFPLRAHSSGTSSKWTRQIGSAGFSWPTARE